MEPKVIPQPKYRRGQRVMHKNGKEGTIIIEILTGDLWWYACTVKQANGLDSVEPFDENDIVSK